MRFRKTERNIMIYLRKLKKDDAPLMLEWMHDINIVKDLRTDFLSKTLEDCENFIQNSQNDEQNLHLAIASETDEYLGTVSLKGINRIPGIAEFGIVIRSCAMRKGISQYGMQQIFKIGFQEKNLNKIYWCVDPKNQRAIRFYDKNECKRIEKDDINKFEIERYTTEEIESYIWYYEKNCVCEQKSVNIDLL